LLVLQSLRALPLLVINLGVEMIYVLEQRLSKVRCF
jgi:hypothetical protein